MALSKYRVIAVNDDESCCDLCGKQNLAKVVWITCEEWPEPRPIGTDCAQRLLNLRTKTPRAVRDLLRQLIVERNGYIPPEVQRKGAA